VIQGGARAGKSFAILLILIATAQDQRNKGKVISIVSETVPHLKRGVMRDFKNIMQEHGYWKDGRWNASDFIYTFETGCIIEFFSADSPDKVRGPARDILFINECNNVSYEVYTQLILRTSGYMPTLTTTPWHEFWVHTEVINRDDAEMIILTYKDNEGLPQSIVDELESRKSNKNFWRVFGLGLIGEAEGKIFTNWYIEDEVPHEARLERRGLDFGYSNDPTAIVDVYYYNGGYIFDEQLYQKGMSNKQIADVIKNLDKPQTMVVCDSSEPKSIDELKLYGINAQPAQKGPGSILQGIQYLQDQQITLTERSTNLRKEYRNYMWKTDKEGKILNVPEDIWNHALDATRYAFESLRPSMNTATPATPSWVKQRVGVR
jgi:phage terminase large subunit